MGINIAVILMAYSPAGLLGRIAHEAFSTLGTILAENLVKWTDLSAMHKFGMVQEKNSFNFESKFNSSWGSLWHIKRSIFPRGNKFRIFFLILYNFCTKLSDLHHSSQIIMKAFFAEKS